MAKYTFTISGRKGSAVIDKFIQALDLGIDGVAGEPFVEAMNITTKMEYTDEMLCKLEESIKHAYEKVGCKDIVVWRML